MFAACGRVEQDKIYMIGGLNPNLENAWTKDMTCIPSITQAMKKQDPKPPLLPETL